MCQRKQSVVGMGSDGSVQRGRNGALSREVAPHRRRRRGVLDGQPKNGVQLIIVDAVGVAKVQAHGAGGGGGTGRVALGERDAGRLGLIGRVIGGRGKRGGQRTGAGVVVGE